MNVMENSASDRVESGLEVTPPQTEAFVLPLGNKVETCCWYRFSIQFTAERRIIVGLKGDGPCDPVTL